MYKSKFLVMLLASSLSMASKFFSYTLLNSETVVFSPSIVINVFSFFCEKTDIEAPKTNNKTIFFIK